MREEQWEVNLAKVEKDFYYPSFDRNLCNLRWLEYKDVSIHSDSKNSKPQHPLGRWEPFQLLQLPKM